VSLDRRSLRKVLGIVCALSFGLNFVWEMLQMPLFRGMGWSPASWALCAAASLGDAAFSATMYAVLALRHQDAKWVCARDAHDVLLITAAGVLTSTVGESLGRNLGWWSYSSLMPLMPGLGVGTAPLVQLASLCVVTFEVVRALNLCAQRAQKSGMTADPVCIGELAAELQLNSNTLGDDEDIDQQVRI